MIAHIAFGFCLGLGFASFCSYLAHRPVRPVEPKNEWVNLAPDGRGGGVWVNPALMAKPFPAATSMEPATPPPPRRCSCDD